MQANQKSFVFFIMKNFLKMNGTYMGYIYIYIILHEKLKGVMDRTVDNQTRGGTRALGSPNKGR